MTMRSCISITCAGCRAPQAQGYARRTHRRRNDDQLQGSYIVIHPFGSSSWKSFPPRRVRELLTELAASEPELSFVITGGPENAEQAEAIVAGMPRTSVAAGLPIRHAAAILRDAVLYVGVDTGTTHLAALMQQNVIALEHNASPEWLPTYDPHAVILTNRDDCACQGRKNGECKVIEDGLPYHRCLYEISDASIQEAVERMLAANKA